MSPGAGPSAVVSGVGTSTEEDSAAVAVGSGSICFSIDWRIPSITTTVSSTARIRPIKIVGGPDGSFALTACLRAIDALSGSYLAYTTPQEGHSSPPWRSSGTS